jgi:hypothetical protein
MKRSRFFGRADHRDFEGARGWRFGRRSVPQAWRQRRQHLQMENEVRRDRGLGGQAAEDAGGRLHAAEAVAGGRHTGQCGVEGSLGKEMVTPAAERKVVAHLRAEFGMSERRACLRRLPPPL